MTVAIFPRPISFIFLSSILRYFFALFGDVSLPSRNACIYTSFTLFFFAISISTKRCLIWECMPASDRSPIRFNGSSFIADFFIAEISTLFLKNDPSSIFASIIESSCLIIRPAPRCSCPTSDPPSVPLGSPTASPHVSSRQVGYSFLILSSTGVFARATALPSLFGFIPMPSSIMIAAIFSLSAIISPLQVYHPCPRHQQGNFPYIS